jgi:polar amino acid transport system substrate-binding protein
MTKRLLVVLAVLSIATAACGKDKNTVSSGSSTASIHTIKAGKLTVCSDIPYAPFEFEDGGTLKGVDVDLVKAIAQKMSLTADFRDTDFDGIFAALAAGNCDMIASSVSITDERKKANNFSDGYFAINQSLLVRKDDATKYTDLPTLKGKVVGVQSETTGAAFATEQATTAGFQVKEYTGADELFTALKAKQIDGVLQDFPINSYNAVTTGDTVVTKKFDANEKEEYGFVIPKKATALLDAVNKGLAGIRSDGTYDKVLKLYLGAAA